MTTCSNCKKSGNNSNAFVTKYNGSVVCLECMIKQQKDFLNFCIYWRRKISSERGLESIDSIIQDTEKSMAVNFAALRDLKLKKNKKRNNNERS